MRWQYIMVVALLVHVGSLHSRSLDTIKYDAWIQKSVKRYWADYPDWQQWKAQLYQESLLETDAISPVGAMGIAQFMPGTWRQIAGELGYPKEASPYTPKLAIYAGAYYMRRLRNGWSSPRPEYERQKLAQASYNAGFGNILRAQKACDGAVLYEGIIACLPQITGHHSKETITYVERIWKWHGYLRSGQ